MSMIVINTKEMSGIKKGKDMATAQVRFNALHQISQNNDHMISRLIFDLEIDGKLFPGLYTEIKQPVGSTYADGMLEVSKPVGYTGPFNFEAFSKGAEKYYKEQHNSMFDFGGNNISGIEMRDNLVIGGGGQQSIISFEISEEDEAW